MSQTVKDFISTYISNGTAVGIVQFNSRAYESAPIRVITSENDRNNLIASVPTYADGGTYIGSGISKCREVCKLFILYFNRRN